MGGIGKTTLAAKLAQDIAPKFERVYWRSLRDAPPARDWLTGAIGFLSDQRLVPSDDEPALRVALLQLLRERPCLLVFDNFETLLEPDTSEGRYRNGYTGYGRLLEAISGGTHQSCLVVTSREAPPELVVLSGGAAHALRLGGLGVADGRALLRDKELSGSPSDWADLIARVGGNGLALKVIGQSIQQLFGGDIGAFVEQSHVVFGGIKRLLDEQVQRSSALEKDVLTRLAVEREPVPITTLLTMLEGSANRGAVLETLEGLRRRSLVERTQPGAAFTLQPVVLEYITDRLVERISDGVTRGNPGELVRHPLIMATAWDYVRRTQEQLIGEPILRHSTA
jgi:hypothetical protein